jgi:hypothetical protein
MVEGVGFEPTKSFRTPDLQSGGFNHSPTPPRMTATQHPWAQLNAVCRLTDAGVWARTAREPQRGFEPLTCRLQIDCATIAPQGRSRRLVRTTAQNDSDGAEPFGNQLTECGL